MLDYSSIQILKNGEMNIMAKFDREMFDINEVKYWKLVVGIILIAVIVANIIIRNSSLMRIYEVNYITLIISNNYGNIGLIAFTLIGMFYIERKKFIEERDKEYGLEKKDGSGGE